MKILILGDVVANHGCEHLLKNLSRFKRENNIDACIANGENSADGNGISAFSASQLTSAGVDFITSGNHAFKREDTYNFLDETDYVIRPCNYPKGTVGAGSGVIDLGRYQIHVINVMGTVYLDSLRCPFDALDDELEKIGSQKFVIVDVHAEATSEKKALGYYLDSRVSAVFGTHTHVQTADEQILPNGTGYITDVGMCGAIESVLGVDKDIIIKKLKSHLPARFETATGKCLANGCIFTLDDKTGKCIDVKRVNF